MFSIGEFSRISGLPVRTLRFYHEKELLVPSAVDAETGYRSYDERNLEMARVIVALRGMEFSLDEIAEILAGATDDADILDHLERKKEKLRARMRQYQNIVGQIERVIQQERTSREVAQMQAILSEFEEKDVPRMLVAGIRMVGCYGDCGQGFATLGKRLGRHIVGKPLCLFYDGEYREGDANFEPCFPIRQVVDVDGISVRELPGIHCLALVHHGHYDGLRNSYARMLKCAKERDYEISLPTREVYLKGPGMIFRGNPKKYLTEIQFPICER